MPGSTHHLQVWFFFRFWTSELFIMIYNSCKTRGFVTKHKYSNKTIVKLCKWNFQKWIHRFDVAEAYGYTRPQYVFPTIGVILKTMAAFYAFTKSHHSCSDIILWQMWVCDGRGATAQELHPSALYLRPLAHPTDMVCTHTHTQTLIPLITIGSYPSETANCPDWQGGGHPKWSGPHHLDKVAFNKPLRHYLCII